MIGVAFSVGFTVGPLIGAYFARRSSLEEVFYHGPALLALLFSTADLLFIFLMLPETLPKHTKVSSWHLFAKFIFDYGLLISSFILVKLESTNMEI